MHIEDKDALALKKHAGRELRRAGLRDLASFEPHTHEWSDLCAKQNELRKVSRSLVDKIKDDMSEAEAREIEQVHDVLMEADDLIEGEKDFRSKAGSRAPRAHGGDPRRPMGEDRTISGTGVELPGNSAEVETGLGREQRMADWARKSGAEVPEGLTLGRYLRSMVVGAANPVEQRALAEGTDSAGGFTMPTALGASLIDLMRHRTVTIQAGARTIPLTSGKNSIAKLASDPVPAWRAENALVAESDPTFAGVALNPKTLAVLVRVSRELLEDSINIEGELPRVLAAALAVELDRVALFGSGAGNEPRGVVNVVGIGAIAHNAALSSYLPLVRARTQIRSAKAEDVSAFVLSTRDEGKLGELVDSTGQPLRAPPAIENVPMLGTTSVPTNQGVGTNESVIVAGEFSRLLIGVRSEIRIEVLRERFADTLQYGFLAHLRADIAVEQPGAFSKITGILP